MHFEKDKALFNSMNNFIVVGDMDEFISEEEIEKHNQFLKDKEINFELIRFIGKHEINQEMLLQLQKGF